MVGENLLFSARELEIISARKRSLRRLCFYTCLSVILFTGGVPAGGCLLHCMLGYTNPLWAGTPTPWQVHPLAGTPGRYTPSWQVPPCSGTPWQATPPGRYTPPAQCMLGYGQQVGGTHPTGMQSCWNIFTSPLPHSAQSSKFVLPSCRGWVGPPPHMSPLLRLHSFLSKITIWGKKSSSNH